MWLFWAPSGRKNLTAFTFGNRDLYVEDLSGALWADIGLIFGYGLVLGSCAFTVRVWAVSNIGRWLGQFLVPVVALAVVSDLIENVLLAATRDFESTSPGVAVTAGAATVKWSSFLVAMIGVIAASIVLVQVAVSIAQARRKRVTRPIGPQSPTNEFKDAEGSDIGTQQAQGANQNAEGAREPTKVGFEEWWVGALAAPASPVPKWTSTADPYASDQNQSAWRKAYSVPGTQTVDDKVVTAVCLSGGGVRSACIAMGALQVFSEQDASSQHTEGPPSTSGTAEPQPDGQTLGSDGSPAHGGSDAIGAAPRILDRLDYVLSVSGGGYTAGARLLAVQPDPTREKPPKDLLVSERFGEASAEFDHFRRHSSYIADSVRSLMLALGFVLKNLLASMVIFLWLPVAAGYAAGYILATFPLAAFIPVDGVNESANRGAVWALTTFLLFAIVTTAVALVVESTRTDEGAEKCRLNILGASQKCIAFALLVGAFSVLIPGMMWAVSSLDISSTNAASAAGGVLGLQYSVAILTMVWARKARVPVQLVVNPSWRDKLPRGVVQLLLVSLTLAVLLLMWLVVFASVATDVYADRAEQPEPNPAVGALQPNPLLWLGIAIVIILVAVSCFADVTSLSLHPFYRWRLARTFAVRAEQDEFKHWTAHRYRDEEATWLHDYGKVPGGKGPKFVFCAAAAVSGEAKPAPGLNAVSFVLGADYIGGPELGWLNTEAVWNAASPRIQRDLTVQAAVAISGAAFASAMGRANKGYQTLLAASGARLGTWLPNPAFVKELQTRTAKPVLRALPIVRGFTYFYRELLGINSSSGRLVQVTDGGHYENLALVEALRRRCRLIYCIDGGGDTPPLLAGLADAIRLAKSELGVEIELEHEGPYGVQKLSPGSGDLFAENHAFFSLNRRLTAGTVTRAKIKYPPAAGFDEGNSEGRLIFAKAALTQRCPHWLLTYAAANEVFPHDSTSDQWFDEGQFTAYTELGRIMARDAIAAEKAPSPKTKAVTRAITTANRP
jgi:hypothetical protein